MDTGYRVDSGGCGESVAWKVMHYEYAELQNEGWLDDLRAFLGVKAEDWTEALVEFVLRWGSVEGIWLCRTKEQAAEYYPRDLNTESPPDVSEIEFTEVEYDRSRIVCDLGDDGFYVLLPEGRRE